MPPLRPAPLRRMQVRRTGPAALPAGKRGTDPGVASRMTLDLHAEFQRADFSLALSRPAEAARILEPVRAADPANQAVLELLARAYFESAQLARAEDVLTRLVELAPSNPWARRALARTLERRSRGGDAAVHHRIADALGAA